MTTVSRTCDSITFKEFCDTCEKISKCSDKYKRAEAIKSFFKPFRDSSDDNLFPILRLLLPQLDRERGPYGLKEFNLAKLYIRILCLPQTEAQKLTEFRAPQCAGSAAGDFGGVLYWILRSRSPEGGILTVKQINEYLEKICCKHAAHDPRGVDSEFESMVYKTSADEQKWLVRIVLKNVKLGLGSRHILKLYHPDADELFDVSNSLSKVCTVLKNPQIRLHELEITPFQPFKPMLSERCDINTISFSGLYYLETKLDGERFQLHYKDNTFKYYSRNGFDYTNNYGGNPENGIFTKLISKQIKSDVHSCILDGEMMGWHTDCKIFGSKGQQFDVKLLRIGNKIQPCFCVFDILMYNDEILTNKPLSERIKILEKVFIPKEGVLVHTPRSNVHNNEEVLKALNDAIDNKEEGILLKDPSSVYKPNARRAGWFKLKPEYTEGAMVELDVLIIGGYYGEGRKRSIVSHFLLGLAVPKPAGQPDIFESLGRVGSGCTDDELSELGDKLNPHWQKYRPNKVPEHLHLAKEKPDLWIKPENSFILQVKATEVVRSNIYFGGYTLRFVRIEKIRYDKPWYNCLTTEEFEKIRMQSSGKLTAGHVVLNIKGPRKRKENHNDSSPSKKTKKDMSNIPQVSNIFLGKEFCVATGTKDISKEKLEEMIFENGGVIVGHPGSNTYCVIGGDPDIRTHNIISAKRHNVVRSTWIQKCILTSNFVKWVPNDLLSATAVTSTKLAEKYNYEKSNIESLKEMFGRFAKGSKNISEEEINNIDLLLFGRISPYSIFRGCKAYFDIGKTQPGEIVSTTMEELLFCFLSGVVEQSITPHTSHVIVNIGCLKSISKLKELKSDFQFKLVSREWILQSWKQKIKLKEDAFIV